MVELEIKPPVGVWFLALLTFAKALWAVLFFLEELFYWKFHGWHGQLSLFLLLQGVICFVVGGGFLRLKRWAYYVTLLMTLLIALIIVSPYIISNVPDTLEDIVIAVFVGEYHIYWVLFFAFYLSGASWASFSTMWLFIVVIYVLLLAFLLHPHIRKAFGITRFLR